MHSQFRPERRAFLKSSVGGIVAAQLGAFVPTLSRSAPADDPSAVPGPLERRGSSKRIIILGAGLSGLVAGYELMRAGHRVNLLEAQTRPGGRVLTLRQPFSDGLYVEAGAGRIPANHFWTKAYVERFGLGLEPFSPPAATRVLYAAGRRRIVTANIDLLDEFNFSPAEKQLGIAGIFQKYILEPLREVRAAGDVTAPGWPPESLRRFDEYTIADFLRSRGASPAAVEFLLLGAYPTEASALFIFRALATTELDQLAKIKGGNDQLPRAMAAALQGRIVYGAQVTRIEQNNLGVLVMFRKGGQQQSMAADAAICTIPFSVLRSIEVTPRFSALKRRFIRELHYAPVVKVALQTRQRYWQQQGLSGFAQLDTSAEIWSPGWDRSGDSGILQLYQEGVGALAMDRMSASSRLAYAAATINGVFPGLQADTARSVSYSWQLNEWARGAYSELRPGQAYTFSRTLSSREGRILFAGEHTSNEPGWMHGALSSGYRAAAEVNELPLE